MSAFVKVYIQILPVLPILLTLMLVECHNIVPPATISNPNTHEENVLQLMENDTVLLQCGSNPHIQYVRWYKEQSLLVDSRYNDTSDSAPEYYRLWSNGSMQIPRIKREDAAEYHCEAQTPENHIRRSYTVVVLHPPKVAISPTESVDARIGATVQVICDAHGIPQPRLFWRFKGDTVENHLLGNRIKFQFEVKSRNSSGIVECVAENGIGEPAVAKINLRVVYAPEIRAEKSVVYTKISSKALLECIATAIPMVSVQWFLHGVPLAFDARMTRHDVEIRTDSNGIETSHTLIYKNVQDSDFGLHECRAENTIGFSSAVIELTGRPMPCVFKINPGVQSSTSHMLVWQTESLSPIMEFKLKFRQIPSGTTTPLSTHVDLKAEWNSLTIPAEISVGPIHITTYTLRGLQPASVYEVIVFARNHFGWSESSKIVRFATGGEVEIPNFSTESEVFITDIKDDNGHNGTIRNQLEHWNDSTNTIDSLSSLSKSSTNCLPCYNAWTQSTVLVLFIILLNWIK